MSASPPPEHPLTLRQRPLAALGLTYLVLSALLRTVLWLRFGVDAGVGASQLPALLAAGAVNDAVVALFLLLPVSLVLALVPGRWRRLARVTALAAGFAFLFGLVYVGAAEFFFFEEFDSRFNLVAVDYLMYPHEVLVNIRDSYPVVPVLLLDAVACLGLTALLAPALAPAPDRRRWRLLAFHGVLAVAAAAYSTRALARFDNRVANEVAINGVSSFFEALRTHEIDYYAYYRTGDPQRMYGILADQLETAGTRLVHRDEGRLDRRFAVRAPSGRDQDVYPTFAAARPRPGRVVLAKAGAGTGMFERTNVVMIVEESLGAEFSGAYGAQPSLTPELDALAEEGLVFTHAYATGTRTVRGLEALVASFPPIPSESIVKRPGNEGIANWGAVMRERGYHTSFLYGGYAYFDNMGYFFSHNGFDVSDRAAIEDVTFSNIWGVCDEDLFRHALGYFDGLERRGRPFFSVVLTTSNHKPFTFPPGVPGVPEEGGGRSAGVRYADYALGKLFREAAGHDWFDHTLFVIVADHDARVYGAAEIPLWSYEIPIVMLGPGCLAPGRVDVPISQIDVAPTVLGLLGEPYTAPFFGQDVLAERDSGSRVLLFNHNHDVALMRGQDLVVLGLHQRVEGFHYERDGRRLDPASPDPELVDLATAYYQTAYDQFTHDLYR